MRFKLENKHTKIMRLIITVMENCEILNNQQIKCTTTGWVPECGSTPHSPHTHLSDGVTDVLVDSVGHLGSLHSAAELHAEDARVMSQPPVISLVTCQPCAVDAGLLTCTNTHNLNIHTRGKRGLEEGPGCYTGVTGCSRHMRSSERR